jgi:hypothetical protein
MARATVQAPLPRQDSTFFGSPKNQRRFLIGSIIVFVAGLAAFISLVVLRGTGNAFNSPISTVPAQIVKKEQKAPVSPVALATARKFIETAVLRKNVDSAWSIAHVDLKGRMTRKQWDTGNIPVVDYPAENAATAKFIVDYSYKTEMMAEIDLIAKPGSGVRPELDFYIGLKRAGDKPNGKWLVSYWEPHWRPPVPMSPN